MATNFPNSIQTFPTMQNITATDAPLVEQYQEYMKAGDIASAQAVLNSIVDGQSKIISADYMNTIADTVNALETYYVNKYSVSCVVSATQPTLGNGDYWFEIQS